MPGAQIIDVTNFMPERVVAVTKDLLGEDSPFYHGVSERRFASPDYLSEDLGTLATQRLLERTGTPPEDLDLILVSCIFTDTFWPGIGPAIQHRVGARNATIMNIDTSCSSYLSGLNAARAYIESEQCRKVAVVTVTNFISRPITVNFSVELIDKIRENAQRLVPEAVLECLRRAGITTAEVDLLITRQPNDLFLDDWRSRIGIQPPRAYDTLAKYGNMFQGTIPVTLADALDAGRVSKGDIVALGTFSNGGDFVSALALRW